MRNKKGYTLILSIITILTVLILAGALFTSLITNADTIHRQNNNIKSYNIAEAGLARGIVQLRDGNDDGSPNTTPFTGSVLPSVDQVDTYSVTFTTLSPTSFRINSTGTYKGMSRTLSLEVFQESFTNWVSLSNSDTSLTNGDAWYRTGEYVDGPVHTNGQLNIAGSPTFEEHVSSVAGTINYGAGSNDPVFNGGLSLNAPNIPMPSSATFLAAISAAAAEGGLTFERDTTIQLFSNGTMIVTTRGLSPPSQLFPLPANGAIYISGGGLTISGTLAGKITIGVAGSVTIPNPLIYAGPRDADGLPTSENNMLGIAAGGKVYISLSAPDNLEIDAYIAAPRGSLIQGDPDAPKDRGTLTLYGGIAQDWASPLGMPVSGGGFAGYRKNYRYDERMGQTPPLYFPNLSDADGRIRYVKKLWQEVR